MQQTQTMLISKMNIKLIKGDRGNKAKASGKSKIVDELEKRGKDETIESITVQRDLTNKIKEINPITSTMLKTTPDSTTVQEFEETTSHSHLKFGSTSQASSGSKKKQTEPKFQYMNLKLNQNKGTPKTKVSKLKRAVNDNKSGIAQTMKPPTPGTRDI